MTQEEKQLLLKDLCAMLPYGVILNVDNGKYREDKKIWPGLFNSDSLWDAKPYLRPMSSMTEEEKEDYNSKFEGREFAWEIYYGSTDWLNAHHLDFRGLIEKGLALEAPEGMYK